MKSGTSLFVKLHNIDVVAVKDRNTRRAFQDKTNLHLNMAKAKKKAVVKEAPKENTAKKPSLEQNTKKSITTEIQTRKTRSCSNVNDNNKNKSNYVKEDTPSKNKAIIDKSTTNLISKDTTKPRTTSRLNNKENNKVNLKKSNALPKKDVKGQKQTKAVKDINEQKVTDEEKLNTPQNKDTKSERTRSTSNIKHSKEENINTSENKVRKHVTKNVATNIPTKSNIRTRGNIIENNDATVNKSQNKQNSPSKRATANKQINLNLNTNFAKVLQVDIINENLIEEQVNIPTKSNIRTRGNIIENNDATVNTSFNKVLQVDIINENLIEKQTSFKRNEPEVVPAQKMGTRSAKSTKIAEKLIKTKVAKKGKKKLENVVVKKGPIQIKLDKFCTMSCKMDIVKKPEKKKPKFYLEKPKQIQESAVGQEKDPEKPVDTKRPKNFINYAEISYNESVITQNPSKPAENKVPVYKQQESNKNDNNLDNTYEFDSDSEKKKVSKKAPRKRKKPTKKVDKNDTNSYDKNMEVVMERLKTKINKQQKVKFVDQKPQNVPSKKPVQEEKITKKLQSNVSKVQKEVEINNSLSHEVLIEPMENPNITIDIPLDVSNNFGFDEAGESPAKPTNDNVVILQNTRLTLDDKSIGSPSFFNRRRPNANSTMLCLPNNSPWRFEGQMGRNPHFLRIKNSALPVIHQEVILNHTFDDKLKENSNTANQSSVVNVTVKEPTQKSIVNFVTVNDTVGKENLPSNISLYDVDQLSPLKKKSNSPRKILGDRNTVNSTPLRGTVNFMRQPDLSIIQALDKNPEEKEHSLFGFSNLEDTVQEQPQNQKNQPKPFRFNLDYLKRYKRKKKVVNIIQEPEVIPEVNKELNNSEESQECEEENVDVRLFEDPEVQEIKEISLPKRKRTKTMPSSSEAKKKKKAKKPKEDPAYKKWVKDMNSTFAEIDEFELEVE